MLNLKVILVTLFVPSHIGHGGQHRGYQVSHDLMQLVGRDNVTVVSLRGWQASQSRSRDPWLRRKKPRRSLKLWAARVWENPCRLLSDTLFSPNSHSPSDFLGYYGELIGCLQPDVSVVEKSGFAGVVAVNRKHSISTIACPQNIESLDAGEFPDNDRWHLHARTYDLVNELRALGCCQERLWISKVEAALAQGLGYPSRFYPYRPVGQIAENLAKIRERRSSVQQDPGLFLLIGSADHSSTGTAFHWFLQQVDEHGLPDGVRVIAVGSGTDRLLPSRQEVRGVELRGWVEQDVLDQLLIRAQAVLVPHRSGFGALTRLSEFACAGVPQIVSRYATYAVDLPPGVRAVDDTGVAWIEAMRTASENRQHREDEYETWHRNQTSTLVSVLRESYAI